jgi:predicted  nucleic acid-binding Zn-ribbon protein
VLKTLQDLLQLQEIDRRAIHLRKDLEDIPARKERTRLRLQDREEAFQKAESAWKHESMAIKKIELDIDTAKENVRRYRQQQFEVKTNDGYRTLLHEIETAGTAIRSLEDSELERMETAEQFKAVMTRARQEVDDDRIRVERECAEMDQRAEALRQELAGIEADRQSRIGDVEPRLLAKYERLLKHVGDAAIVPVDHGTCGGCHMKLPPQVIHDTRRADAITSCTFCGRMLYWRE